MLNLLRTDAYLVKRVLRGHTNDFEKLVTRYSGSVHAVSLAQMRNFTDAEDIAQQAFLKAYQSLDTLKEPAKFGAWICTIARNLAYSQLRKNRNVVSVDDVSESALPVSTPDPASEELRELLRGEVENLEPQAREVLLLYYFGEQRVAHVAALLEITEEAAKKRLQRARAALGDKLQDRIGDLFNDSSRKKRNGGIMAGIAASTPAWKPFVATTFLAKGVVAIAGAAIIGTAAFTAYRASQSEQNAPQEPVVTTQVSSDSSGSVETDTLELSENVSTTLEITETVTASTTATRAAEDTTLPYDVVAGAVTDHEGNPVAGAIVWANYAHYAAPRTAIETQTADDGSFTLKLSEGRWAVKVRKGTLFGVPAPDSQGFIRLSEGDTTTYHQVTLSPAGTLTGRLLDESTNEPIPNAKVWIDQGVELTADGSGTFHYEGILMEGHYISAVTPGYERRMYLYDTSLDPDAHIVLRTKRAGALTGRVVDEAGNPVPNANVGNPGSAHTLILQSRFEQTKFDGTFSRDGITFGAPYRIKAFADGFEESPYQWTTVYEGNAPTPLNFVLKRESEAPKTQSSPGEIPLRYLAGTITDEAGNPISDVNIRWRSTDLYTSSEQAYSNEKGEFEISEAQDIEGVLSAATADYVPLIEAVQPGSWNNLHLTLRTGETVRGKVIDSQGNPVEGAWVTRRRDSSGQKTMWYTNERVYTDANGEFELKGFDPEMLTIDVLKSGYSDVREHKLDPALDSNVITMPSGGALVGRVLLPDGSPAPEFAMLVTVSSEGSKRGSMYAGYNNMGIHFANSDGRFIISEIDADHDFQLVATAYGYGDATLDPVRSTTLDRALNVEGVTLTLTDAPDFDLRIARADDPDAVLSGVQGVLMDEPYRDRFSFPFDEISWSRSIREASDAEGAIHFADVPFSQGTLLVRAPGFARQVYGWNAVTESLEILLEPESRVFGTITNTHGVPLISGHASLTRTMHDDNKTMMSFQSEFSSIAPGQVYFDELPAGDYTFTASDGDKQVATLGFTLGVGVELNLDELE